MQSQQQSSGVSPDTLPPEPRPSCALPSVVAPTVASSTVLRAMVGKTEGRPPFNEISVLFPLLTLYTVGYMGLMAAEFFLRGALRMPSGLMPIYIALVGAYAADKEIRRWAGATEPPRKGSLFVYLWSLLYLAAFIFRTFRPEFILPAEFGPVVLQVVGIFFGSRASKGIYEWRIKPEDKDPAVISQRQDLIMALIRARGRVKNKEVADQLVISSATAQRLLSDMVAKRLIRQVGERKAAFYEAITSP